MVSGIRILVVDDTPINIDLLKSVLEKIDCEVIVANSGVRALELTEQEVPDLIMLDVMMPGIDGFEVCRRLKASTEFQSIPVVFVTSCTEDVSQGFKVGGCDYISKPINPDEVLARVNHHLDKHRLLCELQDLNASLENRVRERTATLAVTNRQLVEEVRERRYMQDRLRYLASHDFVTHLYNRIALEERATAAITKRLMEGVPSLLLLVDIDQFRLVNESCGCNAGDELLRQFAELVSGLCNDSILFARVGGDKFALLCNGMSMDKGSLFSSAIHGVVDCFEFSWDDRMFSLAVTIALVEVSEDIINFDQLMLRADEVLYLAKREGRNGTRVYELDLSDSPGARQHNINWGILLVDALKNDSFRLYFQPIQFLGDEKESANKLKIEVLIRLWDAETEGLIFPDQFIPAAERLNIIPRIDRWVISHVIEFLSNNRDQHHNIESVSINLSALSIRDVGLADFIITALDENNIPAELLCFEITETESIASIEVARVFLERLQSMGCSLALDDFGSGFSSFNYLRELPFDIVKIDGIFIRDMDSNESHRGMVKSIVEISKQMGKQVVAEYVENALIEAQIKAMGVDWGQGYYYCKPVEFTISNIKKRIEYIGLED